jgi:hypothetical protein
VAHFDIPLDLPHAGRLADRILNLLERQTAERGIDAPELMETADRLSNLLFRYSDFDDAPAGDAAVEIRDEAAAIARQLVELIVAAGLTGDRLGQYVRNLFECLELGKEGAEISLVAGENPGSLQRPM